MARKVVVVLVILAIILVARRDRSGRDDEVQTQAGTEQGKYVPYVDEGLGASVAIVVDQSGSMRDTARGDRRPKYRVAREAIVEMLATTDSFIARQPGFPVKVGLFAFASDVSTLVPVAPYDGPALRTALLEMPPPKGGTAIGEAMDAARDALYRSGTIRKYILVVTDGENTDGRSPQSVAREIARRSEGAVRMYFVAFDIDADKFDFVRGVRGEVLSARNGVALRASLDTIYRGKILAEAMDAGETLTTQP
jgi:Mg-chelatase subunit ChlD